MEKKQSREGGVLKGERKGRGGEENVGKKKRSEEEELVSEAFIKEGISSSMKCPSKILCADGSRMEGDETRTTS